MLTVCILLIILAEVAEARLIMIRLSSPSPASTVTGFRVYARSASQSLGATVYNGKPAEVAGVYSMQISVSDVIGTYVTATAYNSNGESARSNEIFFPPSSCGNGVVNSGEGCDDGNTNSWDGCSATCTAEIPVCGNAHRQGAETCDDGNIVSNDGCSSTCSVEVVVCGNGIRQGAETCDDGNTAAWDGCSSRCTVEVPVCGNAHRQGTETCDDGNTVSGDGCSSTCFSEVVVCGNGIRQGAETCDDGNTAAWDGCSASCTVEVPVCGNAHRQGTEACDDGNKTAGDGCSATCTLEVAACGNGIRQTREACDDGNKTAGDGCSATCTLEVAVCGNGIRQSREACDDGNKTAGDGCSATCTLEVARCGNGIREFGEGCDDGNRVGGDRCSARCVVEASRSAPVAYLIDVGGPGFVTSSGQLWMPDTNFASSGRVQASDVPVDLTDNDRLYQTRRYAADTGAPLVLEFPVPGTGPYRVRLHFAELDDAITQAGMRVFDVAVEDAFQLSDVDVFRSVGFARAYSRSFFVNVDDRVLTLRFKPVVGTPMLAGIEISEQAPATGAPEFVDPCVASPADCQ